MKKSVLFVCGMGFVVCALAQNKTIKQVATKPSIRSMNENTAAASKGTPAVKPQRKSPLYLNAPVSDVLTGGTSANAYGGFTRPGRPILDYNPSLNLLTFVHRSNPAVDGTATSGYLMFDYSKDGGTTWNAQKGPIYEPGALNARYPQAIIYNPAGNTVADSASIAFHAPILGACPAVWSGYAHGASKIGGPFPTPPNQVQETFFCDSTGQIIANYEGLIPDAMVNANGTAWVIDWAYDGTDYADSIYLRKGTWNASTKRYDYTTTKIPFTVQIDNAGAKMFITTNVAFSSDGQTGYITALCNDNTVIAPKDSSNYPVIWKSTDGGNTWNGPTRISLASAATQLAWPAAVTTGFQVDGAVDNTGNLHLIFPVGPAAGGQAIGTGAGQWGMFSVITDGTLHTIKLLDKPLTFRGTFGAISEDSRGQIALSTAGDKAFYIWFDTDTNLFPGGQNNNPNAVSRMYHVATSQWDGVNNLTAGTAADGLVTFGYVAYWASQGACATGSYNVHIGYQQMTVDDLSPFNLHYLSGVCITGVNDIPNTVFNVSDIYPNPASGLATLSVNMLKADKITLEVTNLLGQVLYTTTSHLNTGSRDFVMDVSGWNSGVYFCSVKSNEFTITKKLVVE